MNSIDMIEITLKGNPLSTQSCYRTGPNSFRYMIPKAKALKEDYMWQIKEQYKGEIIKANVTLTIVLFFGDRRKRDWDNFHKLSMDALEGTILENDCQIQAAHVYKNYDKEDPRIEISIIDIDGQEEAAT